MRWVLRAGFGLAALVAAAPARPAAILKGEVRVNEVGGLPVPGLPVRADGANTATSDGAGQFVLEFPQARTR